MPKLSRLPSRLAGAPMAVAQPSREEAERLRDRARHRGDNLRKLYRTKRWRDLRLEIAERDGWTCRQTGVLLTGEHPAPNALVVDHIKPHRGNLALFWDPANLQAVSKAYHDGEKQRLEVAADRAGGGVDP